MGLEDGDGLLVLSEVPEADGAIASPDSHEMRLVGTPVETLERMRVPRAGVCVCVCVCV